MSKIFFLDTETTGNVLATDRLSEVCYKIRGEKNIQTELFKPPLPMSVKSMSITHITNEMLADKPPFQGSTMSQTLSTLLEDHILVAHNAPFDIAMIEAEGLKVQKFIDTLRVARALDTEAIIPEYNLQYLRYYLGINIPDAKAHDAESDVLVLEALFERLLEKTIKTEGSEDKALEKMLEISSTPSLMKKFTFGKHMGKTVEEVAGTDRGYLEWLYKQKKEDPSVTEDDDWLYTVKYYLSK